MKKLILNWSAPRWIAFFALGTFAFASTSMAGIGVGASPPAEAELIFDGSREMLDAKWTYWMGPRFKSALPIKWQIVKDPVDAGSNSHFDFGGR